MVISLAALAQNFEICATGLCVICEEFMIFRFWFFPSGFTYLLPEGPGPACESGVVCYMASSKPQIQCVTETL